MGKKFVRCNVERQKKKLPDRRQRHIYNVILDYTTLCVQDSRLKFDDFIIFRLKYSRARSGARVEREKTAGSARWAPLLTVGPVPVGRPATTAIELCARCDTKYSENIFYYCVWPF